MWYKLCSGPNPTAAVMDFNFHCADILCGYGLGKALLDSDNRVTDYANALKDLATTSNTAMEQLELELLHDIANPQQKQDELKAKGSKSKNSKRIHKKKYIVDTSGSIVKAQKAAKKDDALAND